jgi:hypothetical protein
LLASGQSTGSAVDDFATLEERLGAEPSEVSEAPGDAASEPFEERVGAVVAARFFLDDFVD